MCIFIRSFFPNKKIFRAAVIAVLIMILYGCGAQSGRQYDADTNQRVSFHGICFQVPEEWAKAESEEEYNEKVIRKEMEK